MTTVRDDERRLFEILAMMPVGVLVIDVTGRAYFANDEAKRLLGAGVASNPDLEAMRRAYRVCRADSDEELAADEVPITRALNGEPCRDDLELCFPDRRVPLEVQAAPILDESGGISGAVAAFTDITERRRTMAALQTARDEAQTANRAKSDFLARMSHELRTPLNSIIGFSELLEDQAFGALNDKQRRHVANILASGRHLLRLINDILDLSKVEAGRMQLAPSTFDVEIALEEARAIVASLAGAKHQNLTVRCEDSLPPLTADQPKFKQILYNLIGNAIKYTPEHGTVTVTARATPPENGGGPLLEVAVSDTGIGLEPKDQERIFEEFEQVDSRYVREQQGTGLGLALTRKLVQLHGGRIWVESELGVGSAFRFVLPFGQAAPVESRPTPGDARRSDRGSGPLVLVVEDYGPVGNLLAHYLAQSGYSVARAASAGEAIELARKLRPSAITLDMLLPDRDGMELLAQLKAEPETRDIPVVVVSVAENRDLGLGIGAAEWLVKPVDQVRLASALQRALAAAEPTTRPTEVVR